MRLDMKKIFSLLLALSFSFQLFSQWQLKIELNADNDLADLSNYIGTDSFASDAHDDLDIQELTPFPPYVSLYFPHNDWGNWSGDYTKDIRDIELESKTWDGEIYTTETGNHNYILDWYSISDTIPDYYNLDIIINGDSINMISQSQYSFATSAQLNQFAIILSLKEGFPQVVNSLDSLHFSDNYEQIIQLDSIFTVESGYSLDYSFTTNPHLNQSIQESAYSISPIYNWHGTTTAELTAFNSIGSVSEQFVVTRDSTNSPPIIIDTVEEISIPENQSDSLDNVEQYFEDPDLDSLSFSAESSEHIAVSLQAGSLYLIPAAAWFGEETVSLGANDGFNTTTFLNIPVNVTPTKPQPISDLEILVTDSNIHLSWSPITNDINDNPISDLIYKIYGRNQVSDSLNYIDQTTNNFYQMTLNSYNSNHFFLIKVINGGND